MSDPSLALRSQLCLRCRKIDLGPFVSSSSSRHYTGGSYLSQLRKSPSCPLCSLILSCLSSDPEVERLDEGFCVAFWDELGLARSRNHIHPDAVVNRLWFVITYKGESWTTKRYSTSYIHGIQLLSQGSGWSSLLRGRNIKSTLDIPLLQRWLSLCEGRHSSRCVPNELRRRRGLSFRVIDVKARRVVNAPQRCRYVALSYVWGNVEQLQLTEKTRDRLLQDGGLSDTHQHIPWSIQDSLLLCEQLGERYLWVDALCIMQDNEDDRETHILCMGDIYSGAAFTIVSAAGSDANAGLPGVRPGSRRVLQFTANVNGVELITAQCPFLWAVSKSTWDTRGWTFQEKVLSKKLLIFTEHQVFYHCNSATWFEDTVMESEDQDIQLQLQESSHAKTLRKANSDEPAFTQYSTLMQGYAKRHLSHQSDALAAFTGVLGSLSTRLGDRFIWGLPESLFDAAMLWRSHNHFPDRRRPEFPSWSWVAWTAGEGGAPILESFNATDTVSELVWYVLGDRGMPSLIQMQPNQELPRDNVNRSKWRPDQDRIVPALQPTRGPARVVMSHLLRCWTSTAYFEVDYEGPKTEERFGCSQLAIRAEDGTKIGTVYLNTEWRRTRQRQLEFMVLSRDISTWDKKWQNGLNTLLIETVDGISDRVQRPVEPFDEQRWILANPEWKLVTLG